MILFFPYSAVVESVIIEDEFGIETEEMILTCVATGGRPASTITWVMPDNILFSVEEEVGIIVRLNQFIYKVKPKNF